MTSQYLSISLNPSATGSHPKSWQRSGRNAVFSFDKRLDVARTARDAGFDSLWLPDLPHYGVAPTDVPNHPFDPQLLMAALAAAVPDIGLVPTVSSTYTHPYSVARNILTLDRISHGRAGVNIVASFSPTVAQNFGQADVPDYGARYEIADEFLEIVQRLFGSFRLDSELPDHPGDDPNLINAELLRSIDFEGRHLKVRGPITTPNWGSDRPLVATAGGSTHAIDLAAKHADVFYVVAYSRRASLDFNRALRAKAETFGRRPEDIKVVPGISLVLGSTQEEAQRNLDDLVSLSGDTSTPLERVAKFLSLDPSSLHPNRPLSAEQLSRPSATFNRPIGFFRAITDWAKEEHLTVHQLGGRLALGFGHRVLAGNPESIADDLASWRDEGSADGFILHTNLLDEELPLIAEHLMPLLRKRGVVRPGYETKGLRQRFGLE